MRSIYFIAFLLTSIFSIYWLSSAHRDYITALANNVVFAKVIHIPLVNIGNNKSIDVEYNSKMYSVQISSKDYINNKYAVNDNIEVFYSTKFDYMFLAAKNVKYSYYLSILFFAFPLYCLYKLIKK